MRHQVSGKKLNRTKSHRDAMFNNMASSLFEHKKIHTTEIKAKELRPFAERLITKAKKALAKEKQKLLPAGQTIDIHNRRIVGRSIQNKAVLQELFDAIAPALEARNGGYTRIIKTGVRRGDAGRMAIIELVDWSAPQDGTVSNNSKKKARKPIAKKPKAVSVSTKPAEVSKVKEKVTVQPQEEVKADVIEQKELLDVAEEISEVNESVELKNTTETQETSETSKI